MFKELLSYSPVLVRLQLGHLQVMLRHQWMLKWKQYILATHLWAVDHVLLPSLTLKPTAELLITGRMLM